MPFRAKMRRALGGHSSDSSDPTLTKTSSKKSKKDKSQYPDNVYKPGEQMPRPKYRGPYNQAHQDKLSAFSFGDAWKRRMSTSTQKTNGSDYSPMGSKLPSRGPSRAGSAWSGLSGRKGKRDGLGSRQNSVFSGREMVEENAEGDDDIANGMGSNPDRILYDGVSLTKSVCAVGLSRKHTAEQRRPTADDPEIHGLETQKTVTNGYLNGYHEELEDQPTITNGRLFTEDELANAMTQSSLKPSRKDRD